MKPDLLFDVRLVDRNVTKGRLTQAELNGHLAGLPDTADNALNLEASMAERLAVTPALEMAIESAAPADKKAGK